MKLAKNHSAGSFYQCKHPWPDDCKTQCGDRGVVLTKGTLDEAINRPETLKAVLTLQTPHYRTAFFEAFPREPDTFIRGEGEVIAVAESKAWAEWQRTLQCPGHEFESRGYTNGAGFCKHCDLFCCNVITPVYTCQHCGVPTWYSPDNAGGYWCEDHDHLVPPARWTEAHYFKHQWEQYLRDHPEKEANQ